MSNDNIRSPKKTATQNWTENKMREAQPLPLPEVPLKSINPIQELQQFLQKKYPEWQFKMDPSDFNGGIWHLDILGNGKLLFVIEWHSREYYFGLSKVKDYIGYGEKPDEIYKDWKELAGKFCVWAK